MKWITATVFIGINNKWATVSKYWLVSYQSAHPRWDWKRQIIWLDGSCITSGRWPGERGEMRSRWSHMRDRKRDRMWHISTLFFHYTLLLKATHPNTFWPFCSHPDVERTAPQTSYSCYTSSECPQTYIPHVVTSPLSPPTLRWNVFMTMLTWSAGLISIKADRSLWATLKVILFKVTLLLLR